MNRRAFLAGSTGLVLAGCGDTSRLDTATKALARRSVAVDYASYYAPIEDVRRLVRERAVHAGAQLTLSDDDGGAALQVDNLKRWTGPRGGFRAIAVAPFDAARIAPIVKAADAAVIAYVTPIDGQAAAITVDYAAAGARLAALAPDGPALLVIPFDNADTTAIQDPFAPPFDAAARAMAARRDIVLRVSARAVDDGRGAVADAVASTPGIRSILCWNDQTAVGAAAVAGGRWVGALGAPALTGRDGLKALRAGRIDALATPRLRDLTDALVDLPLAYARGRAPGSRTIPYLALGRRSRELDAFASDFAA